MLLFLLELVLLFLLGSLVPVYLLALVCLSALQMGPDLHSGPGSHLGLGLHLDPGSHLGLGLRLDPGLHLGLGLRLDQEINKVLDLNSDQHRQLERE